MFRHHSLSNVLVIPFLLALLIVPQALALSHVGYLYSSDVHRRSIKPASAVSPLYEPASWAYRVKIRVNPDSIAGDGDLLDFPLLLTLNATNAAGIFSRSKEDGSDIVVTKGDGSTPLHRELVTYDPAMQKAEIWFRADTLSKRANVFFIYYGDPDTTIPPTDASVWDQRYIGVYHFAENPAAGVLRDYGPHGDHALAMNGWTSSDTLPGAVGQGWRFNGTSQWIDGDALDCQDSTFTIGGWFALWGLSDPAGGANFAISVEDGYWGLSAKRNASSLLPDIANANGFMTWSPYPIPDTLLHSYVWCLDGVGDSVRFFFDGVEQGYINHYAPEPPYKVYTGNVIGGNVGIASPVYGNVSDLMHGIVDEYRVYEGLRSPDWIRTEYRNEREGPHFFDFYPEEPTPIAPTLEAEATFVGIVVTCSVPLDYGALPFRLYRRVGGEDWRCIAPWLRGEAGSVRYVDAEVEPGILYEYEIEGIGPSGPVGRWGPVGVLASAPPSLDLRLLPNPTANAVKVSFALPRPGDVTLRLFDAAGRELAVRRLPACGAGVHTMDGSVRTWGGGNGRSLAAGTYWMRLETPMGTRSQRWVILR